MSNQEIIRIRDVMASTYVIVDGLMTVHEGIGLARKHQVKALVVQKRNQDDEFGIVLMNDIAKKVLAVDRSPQRTNIYEIMTKPALTVDPNMNVKYCARLFERFGISRAPVIENGQVIGMVSYNNIVMNGMAKGE
ncbi:MULTISPECIES: CBS domain-containing protein [Vibrio]|jgi:signal-transduction protein with cAMP-binding, CBS, and nucleotidyltransferase domain|uniref:CBS domain-containing protein n=1 Tax=Vibrio rotiferianus TaxID=190895 RepID=A0A2K7SYA9_9VIBR|nr:MULTISPECIES: CBS domain-containing protein [Vibrio]ASI97071.1 CBS domain-containing protein [Vibrio rotiferianus]MDK9778116.1 CBS domain-containing protein [Vibrio sp. D401a]MDK9805128.1 CBS domain-containing protein [Vibrio sp. D406a]NOH48754.1 CBS domain-containing protein [Vibrio rotiferianus]NOH67994.1 CBS domain-containing protein [Vibrio rotiferianus]